MKSLIDKFRSYAAGSLIPAVLYLIGTELVHYYGGAVVPDEGPDKAPDCE